MYDCVNVETRELLPVLLHGRLDAATRARVEEHLLGCAECAAELDTLRSVRTVLDAPPTVDVSHIVRALPRPPGLAESEFSRPLSTRARGGRRWADWRVAAAISVITIGGLSIAVNRRASQSGEEGGTVTPPAQSTLTIGGSHEPVPNDSPEVRAARAGGESGAAPTPAALAPRISFGGGVADLETADIEELLGALSEMDAAPLAPAAEPDGAPLLPAIGEEGR